LLRESEPVFEPNTAELVPWPAGALYEHVTGHTVTARLGMACLPALRTLMTMRVCSESDCEVGKLEVVTTTGNEPSGSEASWRGPEDPQADRATAAANPEISEIHPLTGREHTS
jgi:hypothetical protein